jgi:hypothetical protein
VHVNPTVVTPNVNLPGRDFTPSDHFQSDIDWGIKAPGRGDVTDEEHPSAGVLLHELGHVDHFRRRLDSDDPAFDSSGKALHKKRIGLTSEYGNKDWYEGYAESFAQHHAKKWTERSGASHDNINDGIVGNSRAMHDSTAGRYATHYNWEK